MRAANDEVAGGAVVAVTRSGRMTAQELAEMKRLITEPLHVVDEEVYADDAEEAAELFNAEAADARTLFAAAEFELHQLGAVSEELAEVIRERAELRAMVRQQLLSEHRLILS